MITTGLPGSTFLTLREEQRLRVFKNEVLRKSDEIIGEWKKLHNAELMHCVLRLTYFNGKT